MPVLDGDFEAFVTNLGKYNEGELVGEWVKFPTTEEEMQKVFERIGIGSKDEFGQPYEEWFITDYECPIYGVQKMLGEYESLDKLNYLAALIDELSLSDQEKLVAVMEAGCDEVSDIDDLINLTFNLDCYDVMPGISDESDLGYYYAHEIGIYSEKDLGPLADYIDYERYGRDIAMDEQGRFTDAGYVRCTGDSWDRQFDGSLDDIPDEYRISGSADSQEQDSRITVVVVEPEKLRALPMSAPISSLCKVWWAVVSKPFTPLMTRLPLSATRKPSSKVCPSTAPFGMKTETSMTLLPGHLWLWG